ncbi:MAG: hypothetical protein NVS3B26_03690 [Mycobacteriales bacterium]
MSPFRLYRHEGTCVTDTPASPPANRLTTPGWLDSRLVLGVLLVLTSVIVGARVLSSADRSQTVWATTRDLAPGSQLTPEDLTRMRVRLFAHAENYVRGSGPAPTGYILRRGVGAGELLPYNALSKPGEDLSFRYLTVPVARGHLPPDLAPGSQVDVYLSPEAKAGLSTAAVSAPRLVVRNVTVVLRRVTAGLSGATDAEPVVLRVRPSDVTAILAAMSEGRIDLVGVPRKQETESLGTS